jgi:UDP-galactopyranose mutase
MAAKSALATFTPKTSVVYEFPKPEGDPYYPVPGLENQEIYKQSKALVDSTPGIY